VTGKLDREKTHGSSVGVFVLISRGRGGLKKAFPSGRGKGASDRRLKKSGR